MRLSRNFRPAVAVFIAALSIAVTATARGPVIGQLAGIGIENFGQVNDVYYRGSQPQGRDYADLARLGIKTVVDLQNDGDLNEAADATRAGLKFLRVGMSSASVPTTAQIDQFLRIVNDPTNQPVYVHCKGGRHRTGTLTALYRMTHDGWTADRAYEEMLHYDFASGFGHGGQKKLVFNYGANLDRTRLRNAPGAGQQQ